MTVKRMRELSFKKCLACFYMFFSDFASYEKRPSPRGIDEAVR
ncbi:MAG: hypothetical protein ACJAQT_001663 [Akkermansiaceae bacterium]|jgi:hypothetical protein